jgi:energy-coupling factor transporter ATP-binding protein EcfA2
MRIERIALSWFRGAGSGISLDTAGKSVVVYGSNGGGKSTFADALEYVLAGGKVVHLAHEYSGPGQRRGLRNTHAPADAPSVICISFQGRQTLRVEISPTGSLSVAPDQEALFQRVRAWDQTQLILRQDQVAHFVHATKGEKYSALVPLLGLEQVETVAANLQGLRGQVEKVGGVAFLRRRVGELESELQANLGQTSESVVRAALEPLAQQYGIAETGLANLVARLDEAVTRSLDAAQPAVLLAAAIAGMRDVPLDDCHADWQAAEEHAQSAADALLQRRIAVLEATLAFAEALGQEADHIACPACDRPVTRDHLLGHARRQLDELREVREARQRAVAARRRLRGAIDDILHHCSGPEVQTWLTSAEGSGLGRAIDRLRTADLSDPGAGWPPDVRHLLNEVIPPLSAQLGALKLDTPSDAQSLLQQAHTLEMCRRFLELRRLAVQLEGLEALRAALEAAENGVRQAIRDRTQGLIDRISGEVRRLWSKLHPQEPIEDIRLYMPDDTDKAIDIALKFHGVDQPSPRLTLSEGHRNSLGLSIFLALALHQEDKSLPIVLDDIVSSLDRQHRGFVADVLLQDFSDRQILLLTHDREWFRELRSKLPHKQWGFRVLAPWLDPEHGIEWLEAGVDFAEARRLIPTAPEAAGNRTRAFMEIEMAHMAEQLGLLLPYRRGDRNDLRTCNELLERLIAEAGARFKLVDDETVSPYTEAVHRLNEARAHLQAWGNPASHTGSLVAAEAERLVQVCEDALGVFRCQQCDSAVWSARLTSSGYLQCVGGHMRWKA